MSSARVRILFLSLVTLTFFTPLVVFPNSFIFPFIVPKILFFRTLLILLVGSYALLLYTNWERYAPRMTWLTLGVMAFFASFIISTFGGVDWYHSLWDNHERMLGLFTLFHFILYYVVLTATFEERERWRQALWLFAGAGSIVMLIGVCQRIWPDLLLNMGNDRVSATLGNPIYFSGYGLFLGFVGAYLFSQEREGIKRYGAVVIAVLGFLGILFGGTRGTMVGLMMGVLSAMALYAFFWRSQKRERNILLAILGGIFLCAGLLFVFRHSAVVSSIPGVNRLVQTTLTGSTSGTRLIAWKIGIQAWKDHPWIGWGPNNYFYGFNKYYNPELLYRGGWAETWFDNAHNVFVNTLATQGLIGIVTYLSLFILAAFSLLIAYDKKRIDIHTCCLSIAFLVAHTVHNVFVFENPTSYLYFFFFLAFVNSRTNEKNVLTADRRITVPVIMVVLVLCLTMIYTFNLKPAQANQAVLRALMFASTNPSALFTYYDQAITAGSPHVDDIRSDFARTAVDIIPVYVNAKRIDDANGVFRRSYEGLKMNIMIHPLDIRNHIQMALLLQTWAQYTHDARLLSESAAVLESALQSSSQRQQVQYSLSATYLALGQGDKAVSLMEQAIANEPRVGESWWRLAVAHLELKQYDKALQTLKDAEVSGAVFDARGQQVIEQVKTTIASSTAAIGTKKK